MKRGWVAAFGHGTALVLLLGRSDCQKLTVAHTQNDAAALFGIFLLCGAVLMLQIIQTRILSPAAV
jgi:hypothetical protein